jgi:hypothetical protein
VVVPLPLPLVAVPDELLELDLPEELVLELEADPPVPVEPPDPPVPAVNAELHPAATRTPPRTDERKARIKDLLPQRSSRPGRLARAPQRSPHASRHAPGRWTDRLRDRPRDGVGHRGSLGRRASLSLLAAREEAAR